MVPGKGHRNWRQRRHTLALRTHRASLHPVGTPRQIAISALLQSQQTWLPDLAAPTSLADLIRSAAAPARYIAHCLESPRPTAGLAAAEAGASSLILIGPEGDFSSKEVDSALANGFIPVTLGPNRLRTETAGIVAATLLCIR